LTPSGLPGILTIQTEPAAILPTGPRTEMKYA
jgi:hypothetical protein